jgi:hypothetical protein
MTTKKPRTKKSKLTVIHRTYGPGLLQEKRESQTGNAMLVVHFPDGSTRSLLATPSFWVDLPDLDAIPVTQAAAPDESEDQIEEPVIDQDVEPAA